MVTSHGKQGGECILYQGDCAAVGRADLNDGSSLYQVSNYFSPNDKDKEWYCEIQGTTSCVDVVENENGALVDGEPPHVSFEICTAYGASISASEADLEAKSSTDAAQEAAKQAGKTCEPAENCLDNKCNDDGDALGLDSPYYCKLVEKVIKEQRSTLEASSCADTAGGVLIDGVPASYEICATFGAMQEADKSCTPEENCVEAGCQFGGIGGEGKYWCELDGGRLHRSSCKDAKCVNNAGEDEPSCSSNKAISFEICDAFGAAVEAEKAQREAEKSCSPDANCIAQGCVKDGTEPILLEYSSGETAVACDSSSSVVNKGNVDIPAQCDSLCKFDPNGCHHFRFTKSTGKCELELEATDRVYQSR